MARLVRTGLTTRSQGRFPLAFCKDALIDDSLLRDPPYDNAPIEYPGSEALLATLIMLAMDRGSLFIDDGPIDDPGSEALLATLIMLMDLGSLFTDTSNKRDA